MFEEPNNSSCFRQTVIGILVITVGVMLCSVLSVAGIDIVCHNDIERILPLYPGAEIVSEQSGFFRPRAMGLSVVVLTSTDAVADVRKWYLDHHLSVIRGTMDENGQRISPSNIATITTQVDEDQETGLTRITLESECAYN
jgi:hypothetical protein